MNHLVSEKPWDQSHDTKNPDPPDPESDRSTGWCSPWNNWLWSPVFLKWWFTSNFQYTTGCRNIPCGFMMIYGTFLWYKKLNPHLHHWSLWCTSERRTLRQRGMVGPWPWKLAERRELAVPNVDWFPTGLLCINYMFFIVQNRPKDSKLVCQTYYISMVI